MDLHRQANPPLHYSNGGSGQNSRLREDDVLQFLSREEQECIQFFEKTIDSLEESLEENDQELGQVKPRIIHSSTVEVVDGPLASSPSPAVIQSTLPAKQQSPKDQDIIDLVCSGPDMVQNKGHIFNPTSPDFQSMMTPCESHFEVKPKHDTMDSLPSEYNPPLPSGSYGSTDSHFSYQPPGCIPTPVLIAQKIAENQAGGTAYVQPSSVHRRSSIESEKLSSPSTDVPSKQGPPTSAKPTRYPANISLILGNKDNQNHSLSNVNIQERRAQMLANLTGSHPLLQEEYLDSLEQGGRNIPKRSISFKDPTPDKSRMEALSKLGLTRNRAMSGGVSSLVTPNSSSLDPLTSPKTSDKPLQASVPETTITSSTMPEATVITAHQNQVNVSRKSEILRTHSLRSENDRNSSPYPLPPTVTQRSYHPHPLETHASVSPLPEVNSLELNSYGGKSIVVMSSALSKSEPTTSPTTPEPKTLPPALANPSEFNTYGGKSKAITPSPVVVKGNELPDILSSHIKSQTLPPKSTLPPKEHSNYGGKTRTINPSSGLNSQTSHSPARSSKAPAPAPAPRPSQHSYHFPIATPKAAQRSLSPDKEHKRRPGSMFRPQGITVQFSGRGATDESRRDALRKLGLLKDS